MKKPVYLPLLLCLSLIVSLQGQDKKAFSWINPLTKAEEKAALGLSHSTFRSEIIGKDVGYCVFTPPGYDEQQNQSLSYPVIYMLHGGRPGDESKFSDKIPYVWKAIKAGDLLPTIVVLVNGGPVSHYNVPGRPDARGKDIFTDELIPLIDKTYRTVAIREGRGLQGYSQGGRAVARIGFGHPDMFSHLIIGSAGATTEKRIQDNHGEENENLVFAPGDDMWTHTENYANHFSQRFPVKVLLHVGDEMDNNHEGNIAYDQFLTDLEIEHNFIIIPDQKHSSSAYVRIHDKILAFQNDAFRKSLSR